MSETVTYRGPTDDTLSDAYVLPPAVGEDGETYRFPVDVPVTDVPADVVNQLSQVEGHHFDLGKAAAKPGQPYTGYDDASAEDVVGYLEASGDPDLARAIAAYEDDHKGRKTILEAAKALSEPEVSQGP